MARRRMSRRRCRSPLRSKDAHAFDGDSNSSGALPTPSSAAEPVPQTLGLAGWKEEFRRRLGSVDAEHYEP